MYSFGATSTPTKPTTSMSGFSFGAQTNTTPAFGSTAAKPGFGSTATSAFGFGTAATTQSSGFTGFGGTAATSTAPTLGSGFSFGATPSSSTTTLFGGSTGTALATGFGGFGGTSTTSTAPTFNRFGTGTTSTSTGFGGFGSTFGKPTPTSASPFMGLGTGFGLQQSSVLQSGQHQQQQQQQQQQQTTDEIIEQAISKVFIYNDERDSIIAKFNYVQAMWGTGKAFYSNNAPPLEITPENYLCRFKTISYSRIPGKPNKLGNVSLVFNKSFNDVLDQQPQILQNLNQIFGNKQNLLISVNSIRPLSNKTQMIIYIDEKSMINQIIDTRRLLATDISNYLNQPQNNVQLTNLGIESVMAYIRPENDELEKYLEIPPKGIDPRMWLQAKYDNPNPREFLPVPIIGFKQLKKRIELQECETELHSQYLTKVGKDLIELRERHRSSIAKIQALKRHLASMNHLMLTIIVKQECARKIDVSLSPEEEILRNRVENLHSVVMAPLQYKGRLAELLCQSHLPSLGNSNLSTYVVDKELENDVETFLIMQQRAMEFVITIINRDDKILSRMEDELIKLSDLSEILLKK